MIDLRLGDCLEIMRGMADASVDAIVCDPPAGIGMMGAKWDTFPVRDRSKETSRGARKDGGSEQGFARGFDGVKTSPQHRDAFVSFLSAVMAECLRVAKPGANALIWALPRTSHWTGTAIEDAGWRVVDRLCHLHAQGFPKHKYLLKPAVEDWWLATKPGGAKWLGVEQCRIGTNAGWSYPNGRGGKGWQGIESLSQNLDVPMKATAGRWPANAVFSHHPMCEYVGTKRVKSDGHKPKRRGPSTMYANGKGLPSKEQVEWYTADPDGRETVESWKCVDFSGTVPCYEHRNDAWTPLSEPEFLLDRLPSLLQDLNECSTSYKTPLLDVFSAYRTESKRSGDSPNGLFDEVVCALVGSLVPGFRVDCPSCRRFCDEQLRRLLEAVQGGPASLADVLARVHRDLSRPERTRLHPECDPLANCGDSHRHETQPYKHVSKTDGEPFPIVDMPAQACRNSGKKQSERLRNGQHDSTDENSICEADSRETRPCNECRPAFVRSLCLLGADLAWRLFLPGAIIQKNEIHVNLICPVRMLDDQAGERKSGYRPNPCKCNQAVANTFHIDNRTVRGARGHNDSGGASRYFFCSKASRSERNRGLEGMPERVASIGNTEAAGRDPTNPKNYLNGGKRDRVLRGLSPSEPRANHHPTVKPLMLMRWLCRLACPPGGLILDPFAGSGSTGVACIQEGFGFIGIEAELEYHSIAERRLAAAQAEHPLFAGVNA